MKAKIIKRLKTLLVNEIAIDFRACVYFFCVVFFYCVVQLCEKKYSVKILTLAEIVIVNYVICYVQTYLFKNFDESERFGTNEMAGILMCTFLYVLASLAMNWFNGSELVTALFAGYIVFTYVCVILCFIVKRKLDTRQLNKLLSEYKQHEGSNHDVC